MSTALKRPHAEALADAEALRDLFAGCFERWEIAGSVRRGKSEVGDVEHVIIPKFGDHVVPGSMFGEMAETNLLLAKCDELLANGAIAKHVYEVNRADGTTGERQMWGDKYRGIDFRGHMHELFIAHPDNFGAILTIRTGPAEFSERMVTKMKYQTPLEQKGGFVRYKNGGAIYPTRDEQAFFAACQENWIEPKERR